MKIRVSRRPKGIISVRRRSKKQRGISLRERISWDFLISEGDIQSGRRKEENSEAAPKRENFYAGTIYLRGVQYFYVDTGESAPKVNNSEAPVGRISRRREKKITWRTISFYLDPNFAPAGQFLCVVQFFYVDPSCRRQNELIPSACRRDIFSRPRSLKFKYGF